MAHVPLFGMVVCSRTSAQKHEKPCDEAVLTPYTRVDSRAVSDPMHSQYIGEAWYLTGQNHRVVDGRIIRDIPSARWMAPIRNEQDLQAFCEKYGPVILSINRHGEEPRYEIEIYDDYRE